VRERCRRSAAPECFTLYPGLRCAPSWARLSPRLRRFGFSCPDTRAANAEISKFPQTAGPFASLRARSGAEHEMRVHRPSCFSGRPWGQFSLGPILSPSEGEKDGAPGLGERSVALSLSKGGPSFGSRPKSSGNSAAAPRLRNVSHFTQDCAALRSGLDYRRASGALVFRGLIHVLRTRRFSEFPRTAGPFDDLRAGSGAEQENAGAPPLPASAGGWAVGTSQNMGPSSRQARARRACPERSRGDGAPGTPRSRKARDPSTSPGQAPSKRSLGGPHAHPTRSFRWNTICVA